MDSPYQKGNFLTLRQQEDQTSPAAFRVEILELYEPFTLSCVMKVGLPFNHFSRPEAVLKLYDWRYAAQLRRDERIGSWTAHHETAYASFVRSGEAKTFIDHLNNDDDFYEPKEGWGAAEIETYLYDSCAEMFEDETTIYEQLRDYQCREIPQKIASVTLDINLPARSENAQLTEFGQVRGMLIEYIPGFRFSDLDDTKAPRHVWQELVDEAVRITHIFADHNILNRDFRPENILITPDHTLDQRFRVVSIDFAQCRLRREDESDLQWGRAKKREDEEGLVARAIAARLKEQFDFELEEKRSRRFSQYAEAEDETLEEMRNLPQGRLI